jgi:basic amino acid/polyamine antiporter, APA family
MSKKVIGFYTATSIVIANMIGTGVFTSLGFQVGGTNSVFALLLLWVIGGVVALCGALAYGELAAAMPRSGGEYHYLSKIFHPAIGFLSGWVSVTVGFAAPVALAAMALGSYSSKVFEGINPVIIACSVVAALTLIHSTDLRLGSRFQNVFTFLKVALIVIFIFCGFMLGEGQPLSFVPGVQTQTDLLSSSFWISLVYVSYAYSGWNASAYMAGEIENPQRNLPRSLFRGTLVVMLLYLLLNFIFLYTVPMNELAGQLEVGYLAADKIFGATGGRIMGAVIALLLISSVSSMILAGPRVAQAMGEDISLLSVFAVKTQKGIPVYAILLQSVITIILILTSSFEQVLAYVGFTLSLFTFLTVLGLFVLRIRKPDLARPYKTWGYPVTPIIFLALTLWTMIFVFIGKPVESLFGLGTVATGLIFYFAGKKRTAELDNQGAEELESNKVQKVA